MQRPLADAYGRVATDLRVSLTDRCNLRCSYCMPAEGLDWLPHDEVLTDDEVVRLITIGGRAARHPRGPVHRRRAAAAPRPGRHRAGVPARSAPTSETLAHHQRARARRAPRRRSPTAGLDRVNVSLDTVDPSASTTITRRDRLDDVVARRSRRPHDAGLGPVKVNAVLLRGVNDDEAPRAAALGLDHGYELRFIEQMPLDAQHDWSRDRDGHRRGDLRAAASASSP